MDHRADFSLPPTKKKYAGRIIDADSFPSLEIEDLGPAGLWEIEKITASNRAGGKWLFLNNAIYNSNTRISASNGSHTSETILKPEVSMFSDTGKKPYMRIHRLYGEIENLDLWINSSLFNMNPTQVVRDDVRHISYKTRPRPFEATYKDYIVSIYLYPKNERFSRFTREVNLEQVAALAISTKNKKDKPFMELVQAYRSIERLISFGFPYRIMTNKFLASSNRVYDSINGKKYLHGFKLYLHNYAEFAPVKISLPDELLFRLSDANSLQELISKWEKKETALDVPLALYLSQSRSEILENQFINLLQALEAMHRSFYDSHIQPPQDYRSRRQAILKALKGQLNEEDIKLINNSTQFSNEKRLSTRLEELSSAAHKVGVVALQGFDCSKIARTRNNFTHATQQKDIYPLNKLPAICRGLTKVLQVSILSELGFPEKKIQSLITEYTPIYTRTP